MGISVNDYILGKHRKLKIRKAKDGSIEFAIIEPKQRIDTRFYMAMGEKDKLGDYFIRRL